MGGKTRQDVPCQGKRNRGPGGGGAFEISQRERQQLRHLVRGFSLGQVVFARRPNRDGSWLVVEAPDDDDELPPTVR